MLAESPTSLVLYESQQIAPGKTVRRRRVKNNNVCLRIGPRSAKDWPEQIKKAVREKAAQGLLTRDLQQKHFPEMPQHLLNTLTTDVRRAYADQHGTRTAKKSRKKLLPEHHQMTLELSALGYDEEEAARRIMMTGQPWFCSGTVSGRRSDVKRDGPNQVAALRADAAKMSALQKKWGLPSDHFTRCVFVNGVLVPAPAPQQQTLNFDGPKPRQKRKQASATMPPATPQAVVAMAATASTAPVFKVVQKTDEDLAARRLALQERRFALIEGVIESWKKDDVGL